MAHFLTAGYRSKLLSDKNSIRICENIIGQPGRQQLPSYVNYNLIENIYQIPIVKCAICADINLHPIVFPCGHLICGSCYVRHFKMHHYKRFKTYFTTCPECSEYIKYSDAHSLTDEIKFYPRSFASQFYLNALIKCTNHGCDQVFSLYNWVYHMKFCCEHRIVKCPAVQCSFTGTPHDVMTHSVRCIFHLVWCAGCKVNWTVLSTGHNCEASKEYRKLVGATHQPGLTIPSKHFEVVLWNLFTSIQSPDALALEEVEYLVSSYQYKSRNQ
jgi:hypothetical protein